VNWFTITALFCASGAIGSRGLPLRKWLIVRLFLAIFAEFFGSLAEASSVCATNSRRPWPWQRQRDLRTWKIISRHQRARDLRFGLAPLENEGAQGKPDASWHQQPCVRCL